MKPINTSSSTFERFITEDYQYVDKTAGIYRLITDPNTQFFLARPRRFGKTLLVSTLKAIFEGRRELFKGLAIENLMGEKVNVISKTNLLKMKRSAGRPKDMLDIEALSSSET